MKNNLSYVLLMTATLAMFASCSTTSHIEVARGVDFSKYKTFGWLNDSSVKAASRVDNDIVDNNIKNSISAELTQKGWMESDQRPDVWLDYNVMVEKGERRETEPSYIYPYGGYYYNSWRRRSGFYFNPGFFSAYHSYNVPFKEGTLTVNMVDARTNKLIWQGWAKGDVTSKGVTSKTAESDVKTIFKKLDLPME